MPHFYPRSPCGERHTRGQGAPVGITYFYPRSPCGERPGAVLAGIAAPLISIHALLAESDHPRARCARGHHIISIHALLAESDCARGRDRAPAASISIHALLAESDSKSAQNSGALLRI